MKKILTSILGILLCVSLASAAPPDGKKNDKDTGPTYKVPLLFDANDTVIGVMMDLNGDAGYQTVGINIVGTDRFVTLRSPYSWSTPGLHAIFYYADSCQGVPYMGQNAFAAYGNIAYIGDPDAAPVVFKPVFYRNGDGACRAYDSQASARTLVPAIPVLDFNTFAQPYQIKVTY